MPETANYDWDTLFPLYAQFSADLWKDAEERPDLIDEKDFPRYILGLTTEVRRKTIEYFNKGVERVLQERSEQRRAFRESKMEEARRHGTP